MPMSPRLLRPRASGATHPEALNWATRVTANGGTVSSTTLAAVSKFCADIQAAGIRDRFYRLNLFCGDQLAAALVPLYRAESSTASARGNTTDTNNGPFVAADFNNTGASSGLKGNGSSKFLNTGLAVNFSSYTNTHFGCGLLATQTGSAAYRHIMGAYRASVATPAWYSIYSRKNDTVPACHFGNYSASSGFGDTVNTSSLAVGNILTTYPTMYRNGSASGATATAGNDYPNADAVVVFAVNGFTGNVGAVVEHTDARLGWYSIGLGFTAAQALSFHSALTGFNTALART